MKTLEPKPFVEGLFFPEGPRWHDGKLWASDMRGPRRVMTIDAKGHVTEVVKVPQRPSGLGFLPDGRLLVVSMADRKLMRLDPDGLKTHADLSGLVTGNTNDMGVDARGRAYVGNSGAGRPGTSLADVILVTPDSKARVAASGLNFPNGTAITPDGKTLMIAESHGHRITAFTIAADGSLTDRRVFAQLPEDKTPDGICLDADGAIWLGSYMTAEFLRVLPGGTITHRVPVPGKMALACVLGGEDRKTLYLCTAETTVEQVQQDKTRGRIEMVRADVPGAGFP